MEINDKLFETLVSIQSDISDIKSSVSVLVSDNEHVHDSLSDGKSRMEAIAHRLRELETTQSLHKGYFAMLSVAIVTCVGVIATILFS